MRHEDSVTRTQMNAPWKSVLPPRGKYAPSSARNIRADRRLTMKAIGLLGAVTGASLRSSFWPEAKEGVSYKARGSASRPTGHSAVLRKPICR
jgi:hypothetical protein